MALTRIKDVGVDPAAAVQASKISYLFSDTGGAPVSTSIDAVFAAEPINAKVHFGAKGDGVTDDTTALNLALDKAFSLGRPLYIPKGVYVLSQVGSTGRCLLNKGVSMVGDGAVRTIFTFAPSVPNTVDMMLFAPIGGADFVTIERTGWWPGYPNFQSTIKGKRCIHFLWTGSASVSSSKLKVQHNYFFPSSDYSIETECNSIIIQGSPSNAQFSDNHFWGGVKLSNIGDSNVFARNVLRSPVSLRPGFNVFVIDAAGGSAGHNVFRDNNIDCYGGAIWILNGREYIIDGNNIEQSTGGGSSSAAVVDIDGTSGTVISAKVTNNRIAIFGSSTAQTALRFNGSLDGFENCNTLETDVTRGQALLITSNSNGLKRGGATRIGSGWTTPVNNSGVGTKLATYA
ncbi:glycosyl hydrolase family 28-related protein [Rhizobium leguminosarum]|uniref:glycosyl hydrolase family 28-related protein n=1 Tax=Rhizobium leguminosarum TaxID=384 RepID=UPI0014417CFB|nr:glycosyl hydrolase family 28-related protein [Rhizobium leguminosarum]MBY5865982.1 hypothetical protein [Rhizobium leguminosarum]NKM07270.1 hypothetical protein [Rhizobium leguminosarum bv. viciae]